MPTHVSLTAGQLHTPRPRANAGDPTGVVTPAYAGELLHDTTNDDFYVSNGLTTSDWVLVGGGTPLIPIVFSPDLELDVDTTPTPDRLLVQESGGDPRPLTCGGDVAGARIEAIRAENINLANNSGVDITLRLGGAEHGGVRCNRISATDSDLDLSSRISSARTVMLRLEGANTRVDIGSNDLVLGAAIGSPDVGLARATGGLLLKTDGVTSTGPEVSPVPRGHIHEARAAFATVSTVTVGTAAITSQMTDSAGTRLIEFTGTLTADITASGAGGLDTGAEAASTWYAIHVIGDTTGVNATDVLLSTSATAPTLPGTHDVFRRVGWVRNDAGSDFINFAQVGSGRWRRHYIDLTDSTARVLTSGSATTFTDVDLSVFVPPTSEHCLLLVQFETGAGGAATNEIHLRPDGFSASATNSLHHARIGVVSTIKHRWNVELACPGQLIEYEVDDGANNSAHISVAAWDDEL